MMISSAETTAAVPGQKRTAQRSTAAARSTRRTVRLSLGHPREQLRDDHDLGLGLIDVVELAVVPETGEDLLPALEVPLNPVELVRGRPADDDVHAHGLKRVRVRRHSSVPGGSPSTARPTGSHS
jgi:hypothetical protein